MVARTSRATHTTRERERWVYARTYYYYYSTRKRDGATDRHDAREPPDARDPMHKQNVALCNLYVYSIIMGWLV